MDTVTTNDSGWYFSLIIDNQTSHDLVVMNQNLSWGQWCRQADDPGPARVPANQMLEALRVKAKPGPWGYEFGCTWADPTPGEENLGTISIYLDVPYNPMKKNSCSFSSSGLYKIFGWEDIPGTGHSFTRVITVMDIRVLQEGGQNDDRERYADLITAAQADIEDWEDLKQNVTVLDSFDPNKYTPEEYLCPPKIVFIGRSEPYIIDRKLWDGINDPLYINMAQKRACVDEYFAVAVHSINTEPRSIESIPPQVRTYTEKSVEVTSYIRNTLAKNRSIRSGLNLGGGASPGSTIAANLEGAFSLESVTEESTYRIERETKQIIIEPTETHRMFVPWLFLTAVIIYRKKKNGRVDLIAVSEWAQQIVNRVYEYNRYENSSLSTPPRLTVKPPSATGAVGRSTGFIADLGAFRTYESRIQWSAVASDDELKFSGRTGKNIHVTPGTSALGKNYTIRAEVTITGQPTVRASVPFQVR